MDRRQFLLSGSACSLAVLSGCAGFENLEEAADSGIDSESGDNSGEDGSLLGGGAGPAPEVLELIQSESQIIDAANPQSGMFEVTIQNTGISGNIAIGFFWIFERTGEEPEGVDSIGFEPYAKEREMELFFSSGERRSVELTAHPPEDAIGYHFVTQPATYGANIRNAGAEGRVHVTMEYIESGIGGASTNEQTVYIAENSTKEVLFHTRIEPGTEWEITAANHNEE